MNPSFAYIYDPILTDKRWERETQIIENELSRRGIEGNTARASVGGEAKSLVKQFAKQGIKNLVIVGSDRFFQSVVPLFPELDATIGFLPVGPSTIGGLLGIPSGAKAVDVIAARLVETIDMAQINDRPFLFEVTAPNTLAGIDVGGAYRLRPSVRGAIALRNLAMSGQEGMLSDPTDGQLEIVLQAETRAGREWPWQKKLLTETKVFLREGRMMAEQPFEVFIDGEPFEGKLFQFSVLSKKTTIITGKRLSD